MTLQQGNVLIRVLSSETIFIIDYCTLLYTCLSYFWLTVITSSRVMDVLIKINICGVFFFFFPFNRILLVLVYRHCNQLAQGIFMSLLLYVALCYFFKIKLKFYCNTYFYHEILSTLRPGSLFIYQIACTETDFNTC